MLTQARLKALITYDPETGGMTWNMKRGRAHRRDHAGYVAPDGYWRITIDGKSWLLHRLAWLYMTGDEPPAIIDHADLDRTNNRWANLREATKSQNNANSHTRARSATGFKGVFHHKRKFRAQISVDGRCKYLGLFSSPEEAHAAYQRAAEAQYGNFARAA